MAAALAFGGIEIDRTSQSECQSVAKRPPRYINNTNPVLSADTPARRAVEAAGWQVAYDGMELEV